MVVEATTTFHKLNNRRQRNSQAAPVSPQSTRRPLPAPQTLPSRKRGHARIPRNSWTASATVTDDKLIFESPRCILSDETIFPPKPGEAMDQNDRLKTVSEQAGSHRQDGTVYRVSARFSSPEVLKSGMPDFAAARVQELHLPPSASSRRLPEWLDVVVKKFPNLKKLYLPESAAESKTNTRRDRYSTLAEIQESPSSEQSQQVRRLYILYRIPNLVSINGKLVTNSERQVARPEDPNGQRVNRSTWIALPPSEVIRVNSTDVVKVRVALPDDINEPDSEEDLGNLEVKLTASVASDSSALVSAERVRTPVAPQCTQEPSTPVPGLELTMSQGGGVHVDENEPLNDRFEKYSEFSNCPVISSYSYDPDAMNHVTNNGVTPDRSESPDMASQRNVALDENSTAMGLPLFMASSPHTGIGVEINFEQSQKIHPRSSTNQTRKLIPPKTRAVPYTKDCLMAISYSNAEGPLDKPRLTYSENSDDTWMEEIALPALKHDIEPNYAAVTVSSSNKSRSNESGQRITSAGCNLPRVGGASNDAMEVLLVESASDDDVFDGICKTEEDEASDAIDIECAQQEAHACSGGSQSLGPVSVATSTYPSRINGHESNGEHAMKEVTSVVRETQLHDGGTATPENEDKGSGSCPLASSIDPFADGISTAAENFHDTSDKPVHVYDRPSPSDVLVPPAESLQANCGASSFAVENCSNVAFVGVESNRIGYKDGRQEALDVVNDAGAGTCVEELDSFAAAAKTWGCKAELDALVASTNSNAAACKVNSDEFLHETGNAFPVGKNSTGSQPESHPIQTDADAFEVDVTESDSNVNLRKDDASAVDVDATTLQEVASAVESYPTAGGKHGEVGADEADASNLHEFSSTVELNPIATVGQGGDICAVEAAAIGSHHVTSAVKSDPIAAAVEAGDANAADVDTSGSSDHVASADPMATVAEGGDIDAAEPATTSSQKPASTVKSDPIAAVVEAGNSNAAEVNTIVNDIARPSREPGSIPDACGCSAELDAALSTKFVGCEAGSIDGDPDTNPDVANQVEFISDTNAINWTAGFGPDVNTSTVDANAISSELVDCSTQSDSVTNSDVNVHCDVVETPPDSDAVETSAGSEVIEMGTLLLSGTRSETSENEANSVSVDAEIVETVAAKGIGQSNVTRCPDQVEIETPNPPLAMVKEKGSGANEPDRLDRDSDNSMIKEIGREKKPRGDSNGQTCAEVADDGLSVFEDVALSPLREPNHGVAGEESCDQDAPSLVVPLPSLLDDEAKEEEMDGLRPLITAFSGEDFDMDRLEYVSVESSHHCGWNAACGSLAIPIFRTNQLRRLAEQAKNTKSRFRLGLRNRDSKVSPDRSSHRQPFLDVPSPDRVVTEPSFGLHDDENDVVQSFSLEREQQRSLTRSAAPPAASALLDVSAETEGGTRQYLESRMGNTVKLQNAATQGMPSPSQQAYAPPSKTPTRRISAAQSLTSPFPMQFRQRVANQAPVTDPTRPSHGLGLSIRTQIESSDRLIEPVPLPPRQGVGPLNTISSIKAEQPLPFVRVQSSPSKFMERKLGNLPPQIPRGTRRIPSPPSVPRVSRRAKNQWRRKVDARSTSIFDEDEDMSSDDDEEDDIMVYHKE